ncbi:universal stress protein [Halococcus salifodinae]|uniref:UspA domain-containing protein n=1 Tax=Halococcus salifodinae DSM 8989 TaxID=1227456 RepID=M0MRW2_9EURY|nr:universal stress protein [Halococcus salifodinae]EMA48088.1 UspA domain-containing protein [Halococcus salifodinae DSM 8989]
MYDTILIPTDGSEGAKAAARHGVNLAAAFDSHVHFLSVVDERRYTGSIADTDSVVRDQRELFERQATGAVQTLEEIATETPVTCTTAVEHGVPYETILSYANQHDIDLITMGTHGRTGFDRFLVGSMTERVVRTSTVPVLTSRRKPVEHTDYDRILIPTDGSEAATAAIDHGIAIAEQYDATIHALSVVDSSALAGSYDIGVGPDIIEPWEEDCEQAVADVTEKCENRGLNSITEVAQGTPYREIRDYIDNEGLC